MVVCNIRRKNISLAFFDNLPLFIVAFSEITCSVFMLLIWHNVGCRLGCTDGRHGCHTEQTKKNKGGKRGERGADYITTPPPVFQEGG